PFTANNTAFSPPRTWEVDGVLNSGDDNQAWRRLVWGCEGQPLLITEVLAFHDRRVADTEFDTTGKDRENNDDDDLDQVRIPEGSLFIELYAPHNNNAVAATD